MNQLLRNGVSLIAGRILLSAARMLAALAVARLAGAESFGAYAFLLSLMGLAEWLVDFGQTDIAVRDIARRPHRRAATLAALARAKRWQGAAAALALPLLLIASGQGAIALAACAGSVAILAIAALQPARVTLRFALRMDRDIGAELAGVALMLPLLLLASLARAPLPLLIASLAAGRLLQAALTIRWAGPLGPPASRRITAFSLARRAAPLGVAGLLVLLYDALAPLLLARLTDWRAVALFAAATRFTSPALVAIQALNGAFFPILSGQWRRDPAAFAATQQDALFLAMALAAPLFAGLHVAADAIMRLLGPDFAAAAPLLRLMAWVLLARAVTTAMSPLILIAGRQGRAMRLTLAALGAQLSALLLLVPRFGGLGAAIGYLAIELTLGTVAVSALAQSSTGVRLDWRPVAGVAAAAILIALLIGATPLGGTLTGGALAGLLTVAVTFALGHRRLAALRLQERPA
ncbi:lipopolysaccharide biosynthesis protein [Sphingobium sp.]|uniref:lipopolysaccharide biosynthesis protein n=3 Tax=Sphingobium sp. TaxID=1912891 RepID=UPI002E20DE43